MKKTMMLNNSQNTFFFFIVDIIILEINTLILYECDHISWLIYNNRELKGGKNA